MCQPTPRPMPHAGPRSHLRDNPRVSLPELLMLLVILALFVGLPGWIVYRLVTRRR